MTDKIARLTDIRAKNERLRGYRTPYNGPTEKKVFENSRNFISTIYSSYFKLCSLILSFCLFQSGVHCYYIFDASGLWVLDTENLYYG